MGTRWRVVAAGGVLGVVVAVTVAVQSVAVSDSWGASYWVPGAVAAGVVGLLALVRQVHPVALATAALVVAGAATWLSDVAGYPAEPSPAMAIPLAVLVSSCVRSAPPQQAVLVASGGLSIALVCLGLSGWTPPDVPVVAAFDLAAWVAGAVTGVALRLADERGRAVRDMLRSDARLAVARELHDVVAHHVTAIVLQSQAAQLVAAAGPAPVTEALRNIESEGSQSLTAMRRLVGMLRDDAPVAEPTGPEQLSDLVEGFRRIIPGAGLTVSGPVGSLSPEVGATVRSIVREALTNVARHAVDVRVVLVDVTVGAQTVTVTVDDDGRVEGQPVSSTGAGVLRTPVRHYGLLGMEERVRGLGGALEAGPGPEGGWALRATLPIPRSDPR